MLAARVVNTLRFFDLQKLPLTAFEIYTYLIADVETLKTKVDERFELKAHATIATPAVHFDTVLTQLYILTREEKIICKNGFYALPGKEQHIVDRQRNYLHGLHRERLVRRFLVPTKYIPFVRGIALAGSQALGQQRTTSDIDLLIITDSNHMWIARTLLSAWFHILGVRRHGKKIANRFCLNHYLANPREVDAERNLYKAMEYTKLRPVVRAEGIYAFQKANEQWIQQFFPNVSFDQKVTEKPSRLQRFLEKIFLSEAGTWLEATLEDMQLKRIQQDQFVFVREDELSFHPGSKHEVLLKDFFAS